jgi:archaellum biogenesis ATPase FlaH
MARTSEKRNRSVVGQSREGKIAAMIVSGRTNEAIMASMEIDYPEIIPNDDPRRDPKQKKLYRPDLPPFDPIARQRTQEAIRSTRKQDSDKELDIDATLAVVSDAGAVAKPVAESDLANLSRTLCGVPALDYIYGSTNFVHVEDHPDSKYENVESWDIRQQKPITLRQWVRGTWKKGDAMIPDMGGGWLRTREKDGSMRLDIDMTQQKVEHGIPVSFLSIWAGSPGVGKSKTAIALSNSLNQMERKRNLPLKEMRPVLYLNGEELNESKFRLMTGNPDPMLFIARTAPLLRLDAIIEEIYIYRPRVVIVDSLQMIAEWKKGRAAQDAVLVRLNQLKTEEKAGKPHIIFISQLNKQEEMAGRRELEHMVDFVARVTRYEGRTGQFLFECPRKNRGGETPRGAIFRHLPNGIECVSTQRDASKAKFPKLVQPVGPVQPIPALAQNTAPRSALDGELNGGQTV